MNSFHNLHRKNSCSYLCCLAEDWLFLFSLWCGLVPILVLFINQPTSQPVSLGQTCAKWKLNFLWCCGWGYVLTQLLEALWHCATNRKVVVQFLLVLTQPLIEMSTRDVSWGQRRPVHSVDNLATFVCWLFRNSGSLNLLVPKRPAQACTRKALPLIMVVWLGIQMFWMWCCVVRCPLPRDKMSHPRRLKSSWWQLLTICVKYFAGM